MGIYNNTITPTQISCFIEEQFPNFYKEEGPIFVKFIKSYFEWLEEQNNVNYYTRRYYDIKDIDQTLEEFIVHFKNKYLVNIKLDTKVDIRRIIKHALDIYRSKGTERGISLLFKLVYNDDINIYYPSTDLFKLSDGEWYNTRYIELSVNENNFNLVNKKIIGTLSKATAYVDNIIKKLIGTIVVDICYISSINGNFQTNEKIIPIDNSIAVENCPFITGSLNSIEVSALGTGTDYQIGDVLDIVSNYGRGGKGKVVSITDQLGVIDFSLIDGGYGYSTGDEVLISTTTLFINNVTITNNEIISYFNAKENVQQNFVYLTYVNGVSAFSEQQPISTYFANADVMGTGIVVNINQSNTTAGVLYCLLTSGSLENTFYTTANSNYADLAVSNGYFVGTPSTGKILGCFDPIEISLDTVSGAFLEDERIQQSTTFGTISKVVNSSFLQVSNVVGLFKNNLMIQGLTSGATANASYLRLHLGIANSVGVFSSIFSTNNITSTIEINNYNGANSSFEITNLKNIEAISIANNSLANLAILELNAVSWDLPANATANISTTLNDALSFQTINVGTIKTITTLNPGINYSDKVFIYIDSKTKSYNFDTYAEISGLTTNFSIGETVNQPDANMYGKVKDGSNSTILFIEKYSYNKDFILTSNNTTKLIFLQSNAYANIEFLNTDYAPPPMGKNAILENEISYGTGKITSAKVVDSGFGYINNELVTFGNNNGSAYVSTYTHGTGQGYYRNKGGNISDTKKLFDGYFYQNYSYEIISSVVLNKYKDMIEQISHVAGTKMFGKMQHKTRNNENYSISKAVIKKRISNQFIIPRVYVLGTLDEKQAMTCCYNYINLSKTI